MISVALVAFGCCGDVVVCYGCDWFVLVDCIVGFLMSLTGCVL